MNPSQLIKFTDYCIVAVEKVTDYFTKGFIPWGSAFYHPDKKYPCQPLVKTIRVSGEKLPHLTKREKDCLSCVIRGFSVKQIGYDLCCSKGNVDRLLGILRDKFKVKKTHLLIQKALERGFKPS